MDDIRLYSKTLSQTEIDLIYATTNLTLNSSLESPTASGGANIVSSLLELNLDMNTVIVTGEGNIYPSVLELDLLTLSPYVNMAILSDPMLLNVDDALKNPNIKKILKILSTPDSIKSNNVLKLPQIEDNAKSVGRPDSIKSSSVLKKPKLM